MEAINPFAGPRRTSGTIQRRDILLSALLHAAILAMLVVAGLIFRGERAAAPGGGEFVTVEMIVLDTGDTPQDTPVDPVDPVEEHTEPVEEIEEVIEEPVEVVEEVEITEEITEPVEEVEEVEEVESVSPPAEEYISVGSQGEAGSGAPGPASYEGRVFGAIRRNFRTSVNPAQSYRIDFTVNLDGTHSHQVIRTSGDSGFDRAVEHAINSASIPPVPPGRTSPVRLRIEFLGPDPL